jgi:hypothetical protein
MRVFDAAAGADLPWLARALSERLLLAARVHERHLSIGGVTAVCANRARRLASRAGRSCVEEDFDQIPCAEPFEMSGEVSGLLVPQCRWVAMARWMIALVATGAVFVMGVVGCSADGSAPASAPRSVGTDKNKTEPAKSSKLPQPSAARDDQSSQDDSTDSDSNDSDPNDSDSNDSDPNDSNPNPSNPPEEEPVDAGPPVDKTGSCTATVKNHKSVTTLEYTVTGASAKVTKLTVEMTNADARNKNDVDVYVTLPGSYETRGFNSGDILPNGKTTSVPVPSDFKVKAGAKVRISTNFDETFGDPSASCTIEL